MSDSTLRPLTVFHYDSDESFSLELDTDPEPPQGNVFNHSRPVKENLDASFPSGFFKSCEEDDDEYMDSNHVGGGDNEVADSPKIIIFIVEGLDKQIDWELYGRFEVPGSKMIYIPLVAEQAINESDPYNGMMNQAKSLLNIVISHLASDTSDASDVSPIALGFWASDLAASIVKKALVIASEDSHYSFIVDQTSLLVFFRTLPGLSTIRTWETVLLPWAYDYCKDRGMPDFLHLVGPLAAFHKDLSPEFDAIMRCHSMRTVYYDGMNLELKSDDKCLGRFSATFGGVSQARIATPDIDSAVRLDQDQIRFLERKIQDEIDRLESDHLGGLELLALHSPISQMRPGHSIRFDNLAKYILTNTDLKNWLKDAPIASSTRSAWSKSNNSSVIPRNMLAVQPVNPFLDLDIMTNAFICSIDKMASLSEYMILGLCVKSLLIGAHTESVLIIIEQPEEPRVAAPFLDVICLMKGFIETTETTTRIVILSHEVHQGVAIDDTAIAAPVCWDFDDIGIPTTKIDINLTSPDVRDALIKDYNEIINESSHYNDDSQIVQADAELLAMNNLTKLEAFPAVVALSQKPPFHTFRGRDYSPPLDNFSQNGVSGILGLLPKAMEKIVWVGLDWLITAHRPLTCQEFAVALEHEESDAVTAIIRRDQVTLDPDIVFEFVSLFYGLVEVKENRVCLSTALQSHLSIAKSEESLIAEPPFRTLSSAREEITRRCYTYLHSWLHKDTTENATPDATEEREQTEQERNQIPALLLYAIEHLFEFLKSDYFNGEEKAMTPILKKAIEEFIADETMLNRCLHTYKSKGNLVCPPWNITVPSLSRIQERLDLSISDAMAVVLAPIRRHSPWALDNGWQYVALGVIESNNEAILLKADQCKMFDDEKILKIAFEVLSDKSSCVLANSHPDFIQKHSAKLLGNAIRLDNSSFIGHIISQGGAFIKDHDVAEDGATILSSIAQFVAPISHPIVREKYLKYVRHISEAHREDKRSPLHLAAVSGHCLFIEEAISWIKDQEIPPAEALNDRDQFGATALFLASQHGHSDIVTQLIAAGADLAICDEQKQSPLHIASKMGNSKIVAKLVVAGANPNGRDQLQKTPLHLALENRHTAAAANLLLDYTLTTLRYQRSGRCGRYCRYVGPGATTGNILPETQTEELLSHFCTPSPDTSIAGTAKLREITIALPFITASILVSKSFVSVSATKSNHNINVNPKDADGATPLIIATKNNMVEIVKTLLRCDVDVCAKDQPHGQEAIQYAAKYGHTEILELLLAAKPSQKGIDSDWQISSPLHLACRGGHVGSIRCLIEHSFDPNTTDNLSQTALSIAVKSCQTNAVASIASHCTLTNRNTGFLEASRLNFFHIVEILIHAGADVNSVDESSSTALHYCSSNDNSKLMQLLISKRCNLNIVDRSHQTPVFVAVEEGNLSCLKMLIDAGADVNIHNNGGFTPLWMAAYRADDRAVQMLLMANCALSLAYPPTNTGFLEKSLTQHKASVFRHIVSKLAASRKLQLQPQTLLWFLQGGHYDIEKLRILLEIGMDPNLIIGEYGSMLHYAALWGRLELVELLCKFHCVDVNMIHPNKLHGTPLQLAAYQGNDNGPKVIELLLARDANIYKGSGFYGSALNVAAAMPRLKDLKDAKDAKEKSRAEDAYIHMAKLLISREKTIINFSTGYHGTPIQFAVATGSPAMFEFLLTQDPILSRPTGAYGTILHHAARSSILTKALRARLPTEKFDLLLSTRDRCGRLPLHIHFMKKRVSAETIQRLSNNDATLLTTVSFQGLQPLHLAAGVGNCTGVDYILSQHGNIVNDKDADGWTALHWACRDGNKNKEVIELLLKSGADKNATTDRGWTPFDIFHYSNASLIIDPIISSSLEPDEKHRVAPLCLLPGTELDEEEVLPLTTSTIEQLNNWGTHQCDACHVIVGGPVHKCQQCLNFKLCFKCNRRVALLHHTHHAFNWVS